MNTKKVIELQNEIFSEVKNLWELSEQGNKSNIILDNFLDELNMKQTPENRFIAYSRISDLRVEPLELYLKNIAMVIDENNKQSRIKIPNKLSDNRLVMDKAYNYVKRIYEDLWEKFIYELEKNMSSSSLWKGIIGEFKTSEENKIVNEFELIIFRWVLNVWKSFNSFMIDWENSVIKQNEILDKKFWWNSEKIINFLREKNLLEVDEKWEETDRAYSVMKSWKIFSYSVAFPEKVKSIVLALWDFIEELNEVNSEEKNNYINYLNAIKVAFEEKDCTKLLSKWQKVDEHWMSIKGTMQISHPLEFYEDKYRKAVAPEWDLRILDTETLDSVVEKDIKNMYEDIYDEIGREKYQESYNFSKDNFDRVQLYVSEPVMYFGSELNWMFSAQVVPNDEIISERFWKKIFAFPKMVLDSKKKAPLMKLTKEILDESLLEGYLNILDDSKLYFDIYDVETIGHEFGHTLWLTKDTEILMNKKTWNFKNIEEFKATAGWLCSYFYGDKKDFSFDTNILIMHLVRCIWLLKYREVSEILPYYNESLIHLEIMFETWVFKIEDNKIILNFTEENFKILSNNYISHYKKLINTYLEKNDAWDFLFKYVITDKSWNNVSKNEELREFWEYYYDLYKKIGNEVA